MPRLETAQMLTPPSYPLTTTSSAAFDKYRGVGRLSKPLYKPFSPGTRPGAGGESIKLASGAP